jgi:adenylosuccinate lyase
MPHKRNPVRSERVSGLARVLRAHAVVALENVPLWHERDISHSSAERIVLPEATSLLHYLLRETREIVAGLSVNAPRMRENLDRSRGLTQSQALLLALVRSGMSRDEAYRIVQELSGLVRAGDGDLARAARAHPEVSRRLAAREIDALLSEAHSLRNVREIFRRSGIESEVG